MNTLWIRYTTVAATIALAGCGGRGNNNGNTPTGPSCQSSVAGPSNTPCDQCIQTHCQSTYQSALSDCSDYLDCNCACSPNDYQCRTACSDKISAACHGDIDTALQCQSQSCSAECGGGSTQGAAGADVDSGSTPQVTAENGSCAALAACCASLGSTAGAQSSCQKIVSVNDPNLCAGTLSGYQMGGVCR